MSYEVTATRRRPQQFDELIGQEFVVATLKNSLSSGRIAHAYLFAGPRGVGKTSAARILAKALNCPAGPGTDGCETWEGSEEIARGTAMDVIEIDGASNTSVNDVRQIKDEVLFAPNSSRYKIYIIDEVHMLSNSAFNALLKTIEEPPPYIVFVFATTEIHKVPATIRSRCQQFNFRLIPLDRIRECLAATTRELGVSAEEDALGWIAREATGSLRDAYTLFDQVLAFSENSITLDLIHEKLGLLGMERLNALFGAVVRSEVTAVLDLVDEALLAGVSVERFIMDLADYLRTLLLITNGITREGVIGISLDRIPEEVRSGFSREQLETANEIVLQLYRDVRYSVNQRFDLELALSRLANLRKYLSPEELVTRVDALQHELIHSAAHHVRQDDSIGREVAGTERAPGVSASDDPLVNDSAAEFRAAKDDPAAGDAVTEDAVTEDATAEDGAAEDATAEDAAVGDSGKPAVLTGITEEHVRTIISRFKTQRIRVASLLSGASSWSLGEDRLVIAFKDNFAAHSLENDRDAIRDEARAVLGLAALRLDLIVEGQNPVVQESPPVAEHVEMVRRVFRGEIVEGEQ
ncbi:MAG: DNA polymerase III subunit gamma/tau [Spirochaetaceae bacterium]|nr:MAG: DNA polymerase III subunit gamma/tau [Spirochaetaceae bacterium]